MVLLLGAVAMLLLGAVAFVVFVVTDSENSSAILSRTHKVAPEIRSGRPPERSLETCTQENEPRENEPRKSKESWRDTSPQMLILAAAAGGLHHHLLLPPFIFG